MELSEPIPVPLGSSGPMWNHLAGRVISILHGLTRTTVKVMTEDEAIFIVRCPSKRFEEINVRIGQQAMVQVNAHDVLLARAGRWPGKDRWNRWTGRIVLVEPGTEAPMLTVKLQGKSCMLKCTGPVLGLASRPETWDTVNIVVDPEQVAMLPRQSATRSRWAATSVRTYECPRVWLKARVETVRKSASGS
jgi:molybdopterin-binding protein